MYRFMSRFISYRSYYLWRARYRYYTRHLDRWSLLSASCLAGVVLVLWYYARVVGLPPPRVHPDVVAVRLESISREAIHRIALVRHGNGRGGEPFATPEQVRDGTLRTMRVRQVLQSEVVWRLKAHLLADIAEYIDATGGCFPYDCNRVLHHLELLHRAEAENRAITLGLQAILEVPLDRMPDLSGGERLRVRSAWSDGFGDTHDQLWLLGELQGMHARMMLEYPHRAAAPWLARVLHGDALEPPLLW
jgi:hypothetical protein